jgi:hypothetical protein
MAPRTNSDSGACWERSSVLFSSWSGNPEVCVSSCSMVMSFPRAFAELGDEFHRLVAQSQLTAIRQHHDACGRHRLRDRREEEDGVLILRAAKGLLKRVLATPHMQHGGFEHSGIDLLLDDLGGGLHAIWTGAVASRRGEAGEQGHEGTAVHHFVAGFSGSLAWMMKSKSWPWRFAIERDVHGHHLHASGHLGGIGGEFDLEALA